MATKFRKLGFQSQLRKPRRDSRTELGCGLIFLTDGVAQDVPHLFFHAAAVTFGAAFETRFYILFEVANDELGHEGSAPIEIDDIKISQCS